MDIKGPFFPTIFDIRLKDLTFIAAELPPLEIVRDRSYQPNDFDHNLWRSKSKRLPPGNLG